MSTNRFSLSRGRPTARPDVRIKGRGGYTVVEVADDRGDWPEVVDYLARHISQADGFFRDERLALAIGERAVNADDLQAVNEVLEEQNIVLVSLHTGNRDAFLVAHQLGLDVVWEGDAPQPAVRMDRAARRNGERQHAQPARKLYLDLPLGEGGMTHASGIAPTKSSPQSEDPARKGLESQSAAVTPWADEPGEDVSPPPYIHRGTLRSGHSIRHAGAVVILGDVNPGAQVISAGDILIWGRLRGTVHAGAMGDASAIVAALDFEPVQMRIAQHIAMSPKGASSNPGYWFWKRESGGRPEVARVIDNRIYVDPWDANR